MVDNQRELSLRRTAYAVTVLLLFFYFQMGQVNYFLARSIKQGFYLYLPPVLFAGVLYFRRLRDGVEIRLFAAYFAWVVLTQILNGDRVLSRGFLFILDLSLMLPFVELGLTLDAAGRRRVLTVLAAILCVWFFALGLLGVWSFLSGTRLINPITGGWLTNMPYAYGVTRLSMLDTNPNVVAFWYMVSLSLSVYVFFACRRKLWRVPALLSALVDFIVIAFTECAGIMLATSCCCGLLAAMLFWARCKSGKRLPRAAIAVVLAVLAGFGCYRAYKLCFDSRTPILHAIEEKRQPEAVPTRNLYGDATASLLSARSLPAGAAAEAAPLSAELTMSPVVEKLNKLSNGRVRIYLAALEGIRRHPVTLLRGSAAERVMDDVNAVLKPEGADSYSHMHNFLLQTLVLTGLIGFSLVLVICVRLLLSAWRLCFSEKLKLPFAERTLALPLIACLIIGQFESGFFNYTDERTLFFYLIAGFVLGTCREGRRSTAIG